MEIDHKTAYENLIHTLKSNVLGFQQANWAEYTDHSYEHSRRIVKHLGAMIPDKVIAQMNSLEVFVLLASAWLHDIGYAWKRIGKGEEPQDDSEIHRKHHELTSAYVKKNWNILIPALPPAVSERIADVCSCHRKVVDIEQKLPEKLVFIGAGTPVRVRLLSALLRLADAMDTDTQRAPELILDVQGLPEKSKREWRKSQLVEGVGYDVDKNSIIVSSRDIQPDDDRKLFLEKCKDLYEEFHAVRDILNDDGGIRYTSMIVRTHPPEEERNASELFPDLAPAWGKLHALSSRAAARIIHEMTGMGKYDESVYVSRNVEKEFEDFIGSQKVGFAVVGPSGIGKTNLFCHLADKYLKKGYVVLLYNGAFLPSEDIEDIVRKDLERTCLKQAAEVASKENKYIIVLVDGVNDYSPPDILLRNINDLVGRTDTGQVKIALSCRSVIWDRLFDYERVALYGSKFFTPREEQKTILTFFDDCELAYAYSAYKRKYNLKSELNDLSEETKEMLRDPLMLRLVCEAYKERTIPPRTAIHDVFDYYYRTKIFDRRDGRGVAQMRDFLRDLVTEMRRQRTDRLGRDHLRLNPMLRQQIDDLARDSAFVRLKDENVLYEILPHQEVKFTYDRFFEYLLAQKLLSEPFDSERCLGLMKESESFWSLRGAVATALVLGERWDIMRNLSTIEDHVARGILIEAVASLATHNREKTISLMRDLLKSESSSAKRLVVMSSIEIRPVAVDLLEEAMKDEDRSIRRLAVQTAYLLWTRDHDAGEKVAERIASFGLETLASIVGAGGNRGRAVMEASLELQERIFLNNYRDRDAVLLVDRLGIQRLIAAISRAAKMRILGAGIWLTEQMFTRLWNWEYDIWVEPIFEMSRDDREAAKDILKYLNPDLRISSKEKKALYDLAGGAYAGIVHLVLISQIRGDLLNTLPLIRELMKANNKTRATKGLEALAFASRFPELPAEDLELASRMIYSDPSYSFTLIYFGLNLSARRPGRIEFISHILEKARAEGKIDVLGDSIHRIGDIGIHLPDNALSTLDTVIGSAEREVQDALVQALAKIRIFYPDKVDSYLSSRRRDLLGKIPLLELESVPAEIFRVIEFAGYLFEKMPQMREIFVEMLEKYVDVKSKKDFRALLKFCIDRSVETWKNRKFVEEYLRHVEADTQAESFGKERNLSHQTASDQGLGRSDRR